MVPKVRVIVDSLADERARLERFARSLTEEQLARAVPGSAWTVKDFIAHVATLDSAYVGWFSALAGEADRGNHRGTPGFDVDHFNASAVSERRGRTVDDILDEGRTLRAQLTAMMERLSDEQLERTIRFGGDRKRSPLDLKLGDFLPGWARHDAIHVADMLKAVPERENDPEIVAWLGRPEIAGSISAYQKAMG